jgi:4-hydroxy-3-methylbut-2-enyl diphosphate reductase
VEGTIGQIESGIYLVETAEDVDKLQLGDVEKLAYVTQTTLSIDDTANVIAALKERYPDIQGPRKDDICYATQNRQDAVKRLADNCDCVFVVGSTNSSNSNRLKELAEKRGVPSFLIDNADEIDPQWLENVEVLGITAGASAPEILVEGVIKRCMELATATVRDLPGPVENVTFALPKSLR